jgi:DNA-binding NtrC family response regulator
MTLSATSGIVPRGYACDATCGPGVSPRAQEKEIIEAALRKSQGRAFGPSGAAAKLGIARSTLDSKIRSLKINKDRFKS